MLGDGRDAGSDADEDSFEPTQFIRHGVDLLGVRPFKLGVEDRLGIVEDYEQLLGRKEGSEGSQIFRVVDPRTNRFGESGEEMGTRRWELIATDKPAAAAKLVFNEIVVEDREGDRSLSNPACTDESDWFEVFCEADDFLDEFVPSKTDPGRWRWRFTRRNATQM